MANDLDPPEERTRERLLALLRRSECSVGDLAAAVGVSRNAVRIHLAAMARDGLVEAAGVERGTGGKPARRYRITREAEERFPKAYALVLGELIRVIEAREGRDAVVDLLRGIGARAAETHRGAGTGLRERVERAADVLRDLGGDVEVEPSGAGWLIRGFGCPLSAVVAEHPGACALTESLVGEIVGARATECCDRRGHPRCAFRIADDASG